MNIQQKMTKLTDQFQRLNVPSKSWDATPYLGDMNYEHERSSIGMSNAFIEFTLLEWYLSLIWQLFNLS